MELSYATVYGHAIEYTEVIISQPSTTKQIHNIYVKSKSRTKECLSSTSMGLCLVI